MLPKIIERSLPKLTTTERELPLVNEVPLPKVAGSEIEIIVAWTSQVRQEEVSAVVRGVADVVRLTCFKVNIILHGTKPFRLVNLDQLQTKSQIEPIIDAGFGPQLNPDRLIAIPLDRKMSPAMRRYTVTIVDQDIKEGDLNFVFGLAWAGFGTSLSIIRFRNPEHWYGNLKLLRKLAGHEFAHVLDIPKVRSSTGHCESFRCQLNWYNSLADIQILENKGIGFCTNCRKDLKALR